MVLNPPEQASGEPGFDESRALARSGDPFADLVTLMKRLRDPDTGCPWDLEQDFASIAPYTIEEAYEVADAISNGSPADLKGELGDLLFQVVFHSQMADEAGHFDLAQVALSLVDKMESRRPHVFGGASVGAATEVAGVWENVKAAERAGSMTDGARASALAGVALALPALMRAEKLTKRAARVGFDWPSPEPVIAKLHEELDEVAGAAASGSHDALEDELGDVLFVCANLCRKYRVDPEIALRRANAKFERRFRAMEDLAESRGQAFSKLSLSEQDGLWNEVKRHERRPA